MFCICAQSKEDTRYVTEYELQLINEREKELERSKNELQVCTYTPLHVDTPLNERSSLLRV